MAQYCLVLPLKTSSSYTPLNRKPSLLLAWTSAQWDTCCSRSTESTLWMRASWSCYRSPAALRDQWHCGILDIPVKSIIQRREEDERSNCDGNIFMLEQTQRTASDGRLNWEWQPQRYTTENDLLLINLHSQQLLMGVYTWNTVRNNSWSPNRTQCL